MKLSKNFDSDEFKCPCCGEFINSLAFRAFVAKLQDARTEAGIPFVITSGYRCWNHNKDVGGKRDSSHLTGIAVDLRAQTASERFGLINALLKAGFTRIGIGRNFVHVDIDREKPDHLIWVY